MASTFIALPLTSGEAFLLLTKERSREWAILVDSGNRYAAKQHKLTQAIKAAAPGLSKIDVAICTHQDADHANGFKTFADVWCAGGGHIGEYWLPGRWAAAFPQVLTDPDRLAARIFQGAVEATKELRVLADKKGDALSRIGDMDSEDISTFEQSLRIVSVKARIADQFREVMLSDDSETEIWDMDDNHKEKRESRLATSFGIRSSDLNSLRIEIEETDRFFDHTVFSSVPWGPWWYHDSWNFGDLTAIATNMRLFNQAIDTAKSIRAIAESALRWTIPIRWFDFGLFEDTGAPGGGLHGFLEPVCAVELKHPPPTVSNFALFFSLRLSQENVESLVFQRIETSEEPGALFLGDSRLSFGINRPTKDFPMPSTTPRRGVLITSAHHGSRVNDRAYGVVDRWLGSASPVPLYVRNGGQTGQTLGQYLNQSKRRCAQCVQCHGNKWCQPVLLISNLSSWVWPPVSTQACGTPKP